MVKKKQKRDEEDEKRVRNIKQREGKKPVENEENIKRQREENKFDINIYRCLRLIKLQVF